MSILATGSRFGRPSAGCKGSMETCAAGKMISARNPLILGTGHKGLQLSIKNCTGKLFAQGKLVLPRQLTLFRTSRSKDVTRLGAFPKNRSEERLDVYSKEELEVATELWSNRIAYGGTGAVFKGYIRGAAVAIKSFYTDKEGKILYQYEFDQELALLGRIKHDNIIKLLGVCFDGYLVYELLDHSLEHRLSKKFKGPAITWKHRVKIGHDVAAGILFLHECSFVHRDVKPANILLSDDIACCKLCDFGFAVQISEKIVDVKGTHGYMDPFFKEHKTLGQYIDIYSLGVIFLQLITGITDPQYIDLEEIQKNMNGSKFTRFVLDRNAADWSLTNAVRFANLALKCVGMKRLEFPELLRYEILPRLQRIMEHGGKF